MSYDPRAPRREGTCALVDGSGDYEITVPAHGIYAMYVQPSDPEYLDAPKAFVNLPLGATQAYNARLNRLGRLSVLVLKPGSNGELVVAPDVTVEVDPAPAIAWPDTGSGGTTLIKGLAAGSYQLTAEDTPNKGSVNVFVGLNQEREVALPLTDPITSLVGRSVGNIDGAAEPISGASVEVQVVDGYFGVSPIRSALLLATRPDGCFAIQSTQPPGDLADCPAPWVAGPWLRQHQVLSATAGLVRIQAAGYETLSRSPVELSTSDVNTFTLTPLPISFSASMTTNPVAMAPWPDVRFQVSPAAGPTTAISLRAEADPLNPTIGRLVWNDSRLPGAGLVRPGSYDITASLTGYDDHTATLKCAVNGSCAWDGDPLVLPQLGQLSVSAQRSGGAAVNGAVFELRRAGATVQTRTAAANQNSVTFTDLRPSETRYGVRVRGAGHEFRTVGDGTAGCGASTTITIHPGATTTCAVDLTPLGTITGKVTGVLADATDPPPTNPPTRDLAGAAVTVQRCSETTTIEGTLRCTEVSSTAGDTFTGVSDGSGSFSVTGSTSHEGLKEGTWLVTATASGFASAPATGYLPGTAVVLDASLGSVTANVTLYVVPVAVQVKVEDSKSKALTGVTLELLRDGTPVAVAVAEGNGANVRYKFASVVPGHYTLRASGTRLITTTMQIHVLGEPALQSFVMPVGLGSSSLSGKVTETGTTTPLAGADVFLRCADGFTSDVCLEDGDGEPAGVEGTDGAVVAMKTNAQGSFLFQNIPNGDFQVHFRLSGYHDKQTATFTFSHTDGTRPPLEISLDPVTRNVELTVTSTHAQDTSRTIVLTLTNGPHTLTSAALVSGGTNAYTTTLNQVRSGCWTVTASTLSPGSGVLSGPAAGGPPLNCAARQVAVSADGADTAAATAALTLSTGLLKVTPAAVPLDGHSVPDAQLTVTGPGGASVVSGTAVLDSILDVWVIPGNYTAALTADPTSVFWPRVTVETEVASGGTQPLDPVLEEVAGTLTFNVDGLPEDQEAEVTLTPGGGQTASLPVAYLAPVTTTDGSFTFTLPSGEWWLDVTAAGFEDESVVVIVDRLDQVRTISLTALPPPPPP
ncbi:collagen binding domain-containing protein [Nocardioides sp.]|uniref:MSCRAMM family protein n=1 Tax=Nocardioides sp. TaxID=35761 RepID=UPI0027329737|nr:hypothetical protein [Nocardioides sp.]MDP3892637.1 hypothetical protein [Nocardioides sp.]